MTQTLNRAEVIKSLRGFFGFRGATQLEMSETIIPTVQMADTDRPPFHSKAGGVSSAQTAALAANFSFIGLQLPVAGFPPSFRLVPRCFTIWAAVAGFAKFGIVNNTNAVVAGLTVAPGGNSWDSMLETGSGVVIPPAGRIVTGNSVTNVHTNIGSFVVPVSLTPLVLFLDHSIAPGATLLVQNSALNAEIDCSFYWDEYNIG